MITAIAATHCTACGSPIAAGNAFCSACGRQQAATIVVQPQKRSSGLVRIFAAIGMVVVACIVIGAITGEHSSSTNSGNSIAPTDQPTADQPTAVHSIGDTVHIGYWSYRVNGFDWTKTLGTMDEEADAEFLIVDMTIQNDDRTESTLPRIVLVDPQGREFEQSSKGIFANRSFGLLKAVNPGVVSNGTLVFDVPPGHYTMRLSGGYESNDTALVDLREVQAPVKPSAEEEPSAVPVPSKGDRPTTPVAAPMQTADDSSLPSAQDATQTQPSDEPPAAPAAQETQPSNSPPN